jgi:Malectin domain
MFMQNVKRSMPWWFGFSVALLALFLVAGCKCHQKQCCSTKPATCETAASATAPAPASAAAPAVAPAPAAAPAAPLPPVRIKAGLTTSMKDAEGNVWLADQGFADGDITERAEDMPIANTQTPALYRSERYGMTAFSYPVPNGKYIVKLHFAETFEGITAVGERVFSFNVEGHDFKDFDVRAKAGGSQTAYIETVNVEVTDGKLDISFISKVENPMINGIEILPAP